jgi:hypothetical protein
VQHYQIAQAIYRAAVECWPGGALTLGHGASFEDHVCGQVHLLRGDQKLREGLAYVRCIVAVAAIQKSHPHQVVESDGIDPHRNPVATRPRRSSFDAEQVWQLAALFGWVGRCGRMCRHEYGQQFCPRGAHAGDQVGRDRRVACTQDEAVAGSLDRRPDAGEGGEEVVGGPGPRLARLISRLVAATRGRSCCCQHGAGDRIAARLPPTRCLRSRQAPARPSPQPQRFSRFVDCPARQQGCAAAAPISWGERGPGPKNGDKKVSRERDDARLLRGDREVDRAAEAAACVNSSTTHAREGIV